MYKYTGKKSDKSFVEYADAVLDKYIDTIEGFPLLSREKYEVILKDFIFDMGYTLVHLFDKDCSAEDVVVSLTHCSYKIKFKC
jgi:hypothetical protein